MSCSCELSPNCCALVRVPVTHHDLRRLSQACRRSIGSFIEWLGPSQIDMEGEPESFVELDVGRRLMVLRHESDACHLLSADGRCSEYSARPSPCAAYPFAFATTIEPGPDAERVTGVAPAPASGGHRIATRQLVVLSDAPCGTHFPTLDGSAPDPEWVAAVDCVGFELNEYVRIVHCWNRQQRRRRLAGHRSRTAAQYLDFLEQRLLRRESA